MSNTSATGGYLTQAASPAPLEDKEFLRFMHDVFAGITGLPNDMVRPRFQLEPPNQPDIAVDWMAFGIGPRRRETFAVDQHDPTGDGSDVLLRNEEVDFLVSAYGQNAHSIVDKIDDGLQVEQNRAVLTAAGMGHVACGEPIAAPALVKDRWLYRVDLTVTIRRQIRRVYPVLTILTSQVFLDTEVMQETIEVNP